MFYIKSCPTNEQYYIFLEKSKSNVISYHQLLLALAEIALFCKFRSVRQPVRFANVCNVRGLPRRAEAGGQKLIFFFHQTSIKELIFSIRFFQFLLSSFNVRFRFFHLQLTYKDFILCSTKILKKLSIDLIFKIIVRMKCGV